jgi:hypothetical protein
MKQKSRSEKTVQINLWSGDKLWTTIEVPKASADHLADYAKRDGITFDEAFERAVSEHIKEAA